MNTDSERSSPAPNRALFAAYLHLPLPERALVEMAAASWLPLSPALLNRCLARVGVRRPDQAPLGERCVAEAIRRLRKNDLMRPAEGKEAYFHCQHLADEICRRMVHEGRFEPYVRAVMEITAKPYLAPANAWDFFSQDEEHAYCALRTAFYLRHFDEISSFLEGYGIAAGKIRLRRLWWRLLVEPFSPTWLQTLPSAMASRVLSELLSEAESRWLAAEDIYRYVRGHMRAETSGALVEVFARHALLRGDWRVLHSVLSTSEFHRKIYQALRNCLGGQYRAAVERFEDGLHIWRRGCRQRGGYPLSFVAFFYFISRLAIDSRKEDTAAEAQKFASDAAEAMPADAAAFAHLAGIWNWVGKDGWRDSDEIAGKKAPPARPAPGRAMAMEMPPLAVLFGLLASFWDSERWRQQAPLAASLAARSRHAGFLWLESEFAEMAGRSGLEDSKTSARRAADIRRHLHTAALCAAISPQAHWERALATLCAFQPLLSETGKQQRVVWHLDFREDARGYLFSLEAIPILQTKNKKGMWSKGRMIPWPALPKYLGAKSLLTAEDREICLRMVAARSGRTDASAERFDVLLPLFGHPHVYLANSGARLEIVRGEPALRVMASGRQLRLLFYPAVAEHAAENIVAIRETPTRIRVYEISADHRRLCRFLGGEGLTVPAEGKERLLSAVANLSGIIAVHSDISGGQGAAEVPPLMKPHIHLIPTADGLRIEIFFYPFGHTGPAYRAGRGSQVVFAEIDGQRLQTRRDMAREEEIVRTISKDCPGLAPWEEEDDSWLVKDPLEALEVLSQLQTLGEDVALMWPQGGRRRIRAAIGPAQVRLGFRRAEEWFAVSGEARIDENLVLQMSDLLMALEKAQGRFVPIGEGEFIALSEDLRRYLADIKQMAERTAGDFRLTSAAALALSEVGGGIGVVGDEGWRSLRERWQAAVALQPKVPRSFQGELRDYQKEGFDWLMRLAHAGAGACLADDMGLGKTVQALALLLARASGGPALVVAPLSVCANWRQEADRFTPLLRMQEMRQADRQNLLANLGPFDVVVCSYGLLAQEEEALAGIKWHTIILDEAQAIKNPDTKRCRAAHRLQGDFRLALTGTPVENRLDELWSIFHFLMPGLLGNQARFQERFAKAIEERDEKEARLRLRRILRPFILRRTKSQVIEVLPPRIEILRLVTLSEAERALYEALRRAAVAKIESSPLMLPQRQMHILAEIMRLRRACCHPRLVQPDADIASAKMEAFGEILEDLRANRHRALVFSQFVDHLSLVRAELDRRGVSYQYLDGSMTAKARSEAVAAFQAGEGEVFLISLRAGGFGLNLTGADYVIHLDPWWNPAVEDQAADRAHRIGQHRPVTIYRLLAKDTIEEKIVSLHHRKRALAEQILAGTETASRISLATLLQLLKDEAD